MSITWMTLYPGWYAQERESISRRYPQFRVDEGSLEKRVLRYYGELVVRPPGGSKRHAIRLTYPDSTPFEPPVVTPVESLPEYDEHGAVKEQPKALYLARRHQMPRGALCLFQRETRGVVGGECVTGLDALRRAEGWFLGHHTGHWPPDSHESELESHFYYAGDVLVSSAFYDGALGGGGEFFMIRDLRRIVDAVWQEACPLIITTITCHRNHLSSVTDARKDLERIYPWIDADCWSPEQMAIRTTEENDDRLLPAERGWWWSLPEEPEPFQDGKGLLDVLSRVAPQGDPWQLVSSTLGAELTVAGELFFGLRFPGRGGGHEWLVLSIPRPRNQSVGGAVLIRSEDQKRADFEQARVVCYRVHGARPTDFQLRNTGVVNDGIGTKTVALIGLGALGSRIADLLGQAGVGEFRLCDLDRLSIGNVARHLGGVRDFGATKVRIVADRLYSVNPYANVSEIRCDSAVSSLDGLAGFLGEADLTICTVADEGVESAINQVAVAEGKSVLYARALRRGAIGRVFLVRPRRDPCKACLGEYARAGALGESVVDDWISVTEPDDDAIVHECGRPVIPASAIDLSFVATLAARVALDVLEEADHESNHWMWSRSSAIDVDARLDRPFTTLALQLPKSPQCSVCAEPEVKGLILSADARDFIIKEVESSIATETGGILIGYVDQCERAVILRATGPGPKAEKSSTGFNRDVLFVQQELDAATRHLGCRGQYIGEWHSHLVPDPEPSPLDISSMSGIAASSRYASSCPALLIAGLDRNTGKVMRLKAWSFSIGRRIEVLPVEMFDEDRLGA